MKSRFGFSLSLVAPAFALSLVVGCHNSECCEEGECGETKVQLNEVPAVVRATFEKETAGGKITEIEKETKDGKVVYSADAEVGGKAWDIAVAEDGNLISKEVEKK